MLLKSKICFSVLAIYEMIAVTALHFQRICDAMFPSPFCDSWYRYFLFCVIVPLVALLIGMWIREIVRARRRRAFFRRTKETVRSVVSTIRGRISEHIDIRDLEKIVTAAVLVGIKKYADRHPALRRNVNNIMDVASGEIDVDLMSTADEVPPKRRAPTKKQPNKKRKK